MLTLKQSTSVDIRVGPFVDSTDGVTPETGVTLGAADQAEVLKANGAATAAMAGAFVAVTGSDGWYDYTVATGDVDTVGEVVFVVQDASVSLPVYVRAMVLEENVYDAIYLAAASLGTDITGIDTKLDDAMGATFVTGTDSLESLRNRGDAAWTGGPTTSASGTAVAGSTTTLTEEVGQESPENSLIGQILHITSGTGAPQSKAIESNVFATGVITVIGTWPGVSPNSTSVYQVTPADVDEIVVLSVSETSDAVWNANTAGRTGAGTFGEQCKTDIDAVLADTAITIPGLITALNDVSVTAINTEIDTALADIHLDHLLAVDYDPAAKPGVATALLNELIENDAGVSRYTANALEAAPGGAGAANPWLLQNTTITGLSSQTVFDLTAGSADDDAYNGATVVVTDAGTGTQKAVGLVSDYAGSTKTVTLVADPLAAFVMANGDTIDVLAAPKQLVDILLDTGELQADDVPGLIATAQTDLDTLTGADGVTLATAQTLYAPAKAGDTMGLTAAAIDLVWDELLAGHSTSDSAAVHLKDIIADTNELQGDDVPGLIAALNDITANAVWADVLGGTTMSASALLQIAAGVAAGKLSGAGTTSITIRNIEDLADLIVATVDGNGNRSAITITTPAD